MPIKIETREGAVSTTHTGEVVEIRRFKANRNMSDTLDYSDYQVVDCVEALVYIGRVAKGKMIRKSSVPAWESYPKGYYAEGEALDPIDRFQWVDCSNHFVWRGSDVRTPRVDDVRHPDVVIDYCGYLEASEAKRVADEATAKVRAAEETAKRAEEERNRPVKGKRMVVFKGRKVPIGTEGTVAYVHDSGRVLLKAHHEWQNRAANGTWVAAANLKALV